MTRRDTSIVLLSLAAFVTLAASAVVGLVESRPAPVTSITPSSNHDTATGPFGSAATSEDGASVAARSSVTAAEDRDPAQPGAPGEPGAQRLHGPVPEDGVRAFVARVLGASPTGLTDVHRVSLETIAREYDQRRREHLTERRRIVRAIAAEKRGLGLEEELLLSPRDPREMDRFERERRRAATRPLFPGQHVVVSTRGWTTYVVRIDPGESTELDTVDAEWRAFADDTADRVARALADARPLVAPR